MHCQFILTTLGRGGAETHTVNLANAMVELGHRCDVVALKRLPPRYGEELVPHADAAVSWCDARGFIDFRAMRRLAELISERRADVLVAVNEYAMMYAHFAQRLARRRIPVVVTFHTTLVPTLKERLKSRLQRIFFGVSDMLVYISECQAAYWRSRGVRAKAECVIHNGVDIDFFSTRQAGALRAAARRQMGLHDSDYVIGLSARFWPEKNHPQLVDAVARLKEEGVPAKAVLVGGGPNQSAVEDYVRARGLSDAVIFAGEKKDVRPYIAAFDVGVLCSTMETFSVAALEIMAMGRPMVLSALGGASEMVIEGKNGFLFPVGDTGAFVAHLRALYDNNRRSLMGSKARQIVVERFSHGEMVRSYCQVLGSIHG
jgi:glycosyltransferase involved in cell wall biosynthesis